MGKMLVQALMLAGAAFILVGGIGLLRMPDTYMRISAVAKVLTLGVGCLLIAAAMHFQDIAVTTRAAVIMVFFFLTSPVSAHILGRAAYLSKTPLWERTLKDELQGQYDLQAGSLRSPTSPPADPAKAHQKPDPKEPEPAQGSDRPYPKDPI